MDIDNKRFRIIRVTVTKDYFVEMYDEEKTVINGWTIEEVIKDWFIKFKSSSYHITRDSSEIGNSMKYIRHEVINPYEEEKND